MPIIFLNNVTNDQKVIRRNSEKIDLRISFLSLVFVLLQIKISLFHAKLEVSKVKVALVVYGS